MARLSRLLAVVALSVGLLLVPVAADADSPDLKNGAPLTSSIYILDANTIAKESGLPPCDLASVVVDARSQVPYTLEYSLQNKEKNVIPTPHYFSGNSAPWFARQAVEASPYWTRDISDASIILVDDYCYKLSWLSNIHSGTGQAPGETLMKIYANVTARPEWRQSLGSNHVFFQSHTGFAQGSLGDLYETFLCKTLVNSMHIVNVRATRLRCKEAPYVAESVLVAPASVTFHDIRDFQASERERLYGSALQGYNIEREFLVFFKGKCTAWYIDWKEDAVKYGLSQSTTNVGKLMRALIAEQIQDMGPDVKMACTGDPELLAQKHLAEHAERPHWEQMDDFMRSTFCLLMPGDSQTSRRVPEAIMTGCIPVFPGPPFHTLPFANLVDYSQFAIFFQFNNTPWADSITIHWKVEQDARPNHPTDAEWWVPDMENIQELAVHVNNAEQMVNYLREMPKDKLVQYQQAVLAVQPNFAYLLSPEQEGTSAAELIVEAMVQRERLQKGNPPQLIQPKDLILEGLRLSSLLH